MKDGAEGADVPFLLLRLSSVVSHADLLADSGLAPLRGVECPLKGWWVKALLGDFCFGEVSEVPKEYAGA